MAQKLYTVNEAMAYLSLSRSGINSLFKSGRLKRVKLNGVTDGSNRSGVRITEKDMEEYIQSLERI